MKFKNLLLTLAATVVTMAAVAQTDGFAYQAVVRNAQGELISSKNVQLRLTLTAADGTLLYQETQTAKTNDYGVLSVTVGAGKAVQKTFSNVDWSKGNISMKVEIDANGGTNYTDLGITKLQAVPYAYFAANSPGGKGEKGEKGADGVGIDTVSNADGSVTFKLTNGQTYTYNLKGEPGEPGRDGMQVSGTKGQTLVHDGTTWVATDQIALSKLDVKADDSSSEALFEVKDKDGNVVFAVYPNAVRVYVDEEADGSKPVPTGFAVAGRRAAKEGNGDIFAVNAEGTKVYIDNDGGKPVPTGFAVAGRRAGKDANIDYLSVNTTGTQIYFDDNEADGTKPVSTGLAVAGRRAGKDGEISDYLVVNKAGTQVYFDNDDDKDGAKPVSTGLAVAGRRAGKDGATSDYLVVNQAGTKVYFDNDNEDGAKPVSTGLAVAGRRAGKDGAAEEYMTINADSTRFYINKPTGSKDGSGFAVSGREGSSKGSNGAGGFAVSGRDGSKGSFATDLFNIDLATDAKTLNEENRVYWYPEKNAFMAGNLKIESPDSVGVNSFNAGFQNKAIGQYSQALGYKAVAKGDFTTAIGRGAMADSINAYAFGDSAHAQGKGSYAIGAGAIASGMSSFAIGSIAQDSSGNPLQAPQATGDYSYAIGAATRATGANSLAMGSGSEAPGIGSVAIGISAKADLWYSTALGVSTLSEGTGSIAMGFLTRAAADEGAYDSPAAATAMGFSTRATSWCATAMGHSSRAIGSISTAMGMGTLASGDQSTSMGWSTIASGSASTAMGGITQALGDYSTALGYQTVAKSNYEIVVGRLNTDYEALSPDYYPWLYYGYVEPQIEGRNRLFTIGNGMIHNGYYDYWDNWIEGDTLKSDAMIVYKDGNTEFRGNVYPSNEKNIWTGAISWWDGGSPYDLGLSSHRWNTVYACNLDISANTNMQFLTVSGSVLSSLLPTNSDSQNLGLENRRWKSVYAQNIFGESLQTDRLQTTESATIGGNLSISGNMNVSGNIESSLIPPSSFTYVLGTDEKRWHSVYANYLYGESIQTGSLQTTEGASVGGDLSVSGNLWVSGNVTPPNVTYNLGAAYNRWNKIYVDSISVCHVDSSLIPTKANFDLGSIVSPWNAVYTTDGTVQTSDKRLKTNIKPLEKALDKVLTLNGVTYEWRVKEFPQRNFDNKTHVGVLAQELEAVLPEAVETGADGYKSVNYSEITPLLIEAMKEQQAIIDNQQKQIDELKKMVEELMNK